MRPRKCHPPGGKGEGAEGSCSPLASAPACFWQEAGSLAKATPTSSVNHSGAPTGSLEVTLEEAVCEVLGLAQPGSGHSAPPPDGPLRNTCAQRASRAFSLGGSCRFAAVCPTSPPRPPHGTARDPGLARAVPPSGWHNPRGRAQSQWPQGLCLGLSASEIQLV